MQNTDPLPVEGTDPLIVVAIIIAAIVVAFALFIWFKGRPFASGTVFRARRLSGGNRLFPTQVQITPSAVVHFTPQWIGRREHSIHIAHVSSVTIETNMLFSDVLIETSGGSAPVVCHGHSKRDALEMKRLVEHYQSLYYRQAPGQASSPAPVVLDDTSR
jgi:hypothetical protein